MSREAKPPEDDADSAVSDDAASGADIKVRLVRASDAEALSASCFTELTRARVDERIERAVEQHRTGAGACLVLELQGEVVAAGQVVCHKGRTGHVCNVVVAEGHRGKGLLSVLMDGLARAAGDLGADRLRLLVELDNTSALKAYAKLRFRRVDAAEGVVWLERDIKG